MSSKTHKTEFAVAEETNMARLSAPANKTPKTDRKPSRFREIFKHRPSSNTSSSPATLAQSPSPAAPNPLLSSAMRTGFQHVGLLPGERSSHSLPRILGSEEGRDMDTESTATEARRRSAQSVSVACNASYDLISSDPRSTNHDAEPRSSLPVGSSHKIAEAMYNETNSSYIEDGTDGFKSFLKQPYKPDFTDDSGPAADVSLNQDSRLFKKMAKDDFLAEVPMSGQIAPSIETANEPEMVTAPLGEDGRSSHRKSFASNIFDDDSSLSQGIREYVTSKIAEAFAEHDRAHFSDVDTMANPSVHITIKVGATSLSEAIISSTPSISDNRTDISKGLSSVGAVKITNALLTHNTQLAIKTLYAVVLLSASLLGPKTLLLTVWRMAIVLALYAAVLCQLDWIGNLEHDVFLTPVFSTASMAKGIGKQVLIYVRSAMIVVIAETLERVAHSVGVQVGTEQLPSGNTRYLDI